MGSARPLIPATSAARRLRRHGPVRGRATGAHGGTAGSSNRRSAMQPGDVHRPPGWPVQRSAVPVCQGSISAARDLRADAVGDNDVYSDRNVAGSTRLCQAGTSWPLVASSARAAMSARTYSRTTRDLPAASNRVPDGAEICKACAVRREARQARRPADRSMGPMTTGMATGVQSRPGRHR